MSNKVMKTTAAIMFLVALALAGCGSSSSTKADSGSGGSSTGASATSGGSSDSGSGGGSGGDCGGYESGKDGVVRTFCDGSGSAKVTIAGAEHTYEGLDCQTYGTELNMNAGVVVGPDFTGAKPDYFGLTIPAKGGDFTNATLAVTADGKGYALTENSGTGDDTSGTFKGTSYGDNVEISGSYTC